ncbi:uncharacterized protein I206_101194 [Kwoniella pini CBS 10737]|uniref:SGNH hydrolase-type esterase domain-containing protein n=1 Tax=Kwoniella pini CBS 10737 TaxID=1296096 RepID=A0A1B9IBM8_9TREE|nr:uncharacterized protein I206_00129 [Kwoniella pini CBS 10737]OCF52833.1 hypothetical protein I206_00129 [Kwoniella pini CBS 10737]
MFKPISHCIVLCCILILSPHLVLSLPSPSTSSYNESKDSQKARLPGKFVPFSKLSTCPTLKHRKAPKHAKDVRPDDFKVIAALGDSITAALLARGSREDSHSHPLSKYSSSKSSQDQKSFQLKNIPEIAEWRGISYATGFDENAITIPNILKYYNSDLIGPSTGHHSPISCLGTGWDIGCGLHPSEDGLNAAISGSLSAGLLSQVKDYLIPRMIEFEVKDDDWKYVNLGIGANDVCAFCLTPNSTIFPSSGTPKQFARNIQKAVNELRIHVPNLIVNIIGLMRVSDIYELTLKDPYCQTPGLPFPHLALECNCALLPGPAGDYTRQRMDEQGKAYDEAVLEIIKGWEEENDPSFAAIWQPGTAVDLANYPIEALSKIDCFHPSELSHQRVAVGLWNRLTLSLDDKYKPIPWEEEPMIRCLEEDDRIRIGEIGRLYQSEKLLRV